LKSHPSYLQKFATGLENIQKDIHECAKCFALTDTKNKYCSICEDTRRDKTSICVVEDYLDMIALDRLGIYKGNFHILGGAISPINGILPSDLKIKELFNRIEKDEIHELIMATNPNIEGEATVMYIRENLPER
jgi:recombination protein RecR